MEPMQTFLIAPGYAGFKETAAILDRARLGKQRVEAYQILRSLLEITSGWRKHPAVRMWEGHEVNLVMYGQVICEEWISRGYNDTMFGKITDLLEDIPLDSTCRWSFPDWTRDHNFHLAHKSNLIRKDPEHYQSIWPDVPNDLPYVWPK